MFGLTEKLMEFEDGMLTFEEVVDLFQRLVDTGLAWRLQGFYGRTAAELIRNGYVTEDK
jgi:hypothetical protein